jgi:hypothetical protein
MAGLVDPNADVVAYYQRGQLLSIDEHDPKRVTFGGETLGSLGEIGGCVLVLGCETLSYPTAHP